MHKAPKETVGELDVCSPGHPPTHEFMKGAMHKTLLWCFLCLLNPSASIMLIYRKQFSHNMTFSFFPKNQKGHY